MTTRPFVRSSRSFAVRPKLFWTSQNDPLEDLLFVGTIARRVGRGISGFALNF